jgi:hypothetical protein
MGILGPSYTYTYHIIRYINTYARLMHVQSGLFVFIKIFLRKSPSTLAYGQAACRGETKGDPSPAFADAKGGENLEPDRLEWAETMSFNASASGIRKRSVHAHRDVKQTAS